MIRATFVKEMQLFARDRAGLFATFLMPAVFIIGFGLMFRGAGGPDDDDDDGGGRQLKKVELAVWHEAGHDEAEQIVKWILASQTFNVTKTDSAEATRTGVADKKFRAGLIFPRDFHARNRPAELCMDLAVPEMERIAVQAPLRGAFSGHHGMKMSPVKIDPANMPAGPPFFEPKSPPGVKKAIENLDSFQVSVPGNAVLFCFFLGLAVAMGFYEERKNGTWRRLLAAPGSRTKMLVAKLLPAGAIGCAQVAVLFALGHFAFGMRIGGSVFALCVITVCVVFAATSLGLLIASFGGTEKQIAGYSTIVILGMGLVGGCMFPRMFMPDGIKTAGNFVPHGWALDAYYEILVRTGTTLADVWQNCLVIAGFGVLFTALASAFFRYER